VTWRPLQFLVLNVVAGPLIFLSPILVLGTFFSPYILTLLIWIYPASTPATLAFSLAVWPSIARSGHITLASGLIACAIAALVWPFGVEIIADRKMPSDWLALRRFPWIYGAFLMNMMAALLMADIGHRLGLLTAGPTTRTG
jgi:hypothetical protein